MVFSRYSAVLLLRRVTNNFNLKECRQKTYIPQLSSINKNYSTFEKSENDKYKMHELVPSLVENKGSEALPISSLEFHDIDFENSDYLPDIVEKRPGPLDPCVDDLSHIGPDFPVAFNFAAYADKSPMIQRLAELGVDFSKIEKREDVPKRLMPLDFERDMKYHIRFLNDCGVPADQLGEFLTKNPLIFFEDLDDLYTRIRYLSAHKFSPDMIARIVTKNPFWVMFSTKRIDTRLGYFQKEFTLTGGEIRALATKQPRLITYNMEHVKENTFAVRELMGFDKYETKLILLTKPRIWMKTRDFVVNTFDYAHNEMKIPHEMIAQQPGVLVCRLHRLKQRHMFLVSLNRAQYDPLKPMYVSLHSLISGSDTEFCTNVAKTPVETFNMFLKTL